MENTFYVLGCSLLILLIIDLLASKIKKIIITIKVKNAINNLSEEIVKAIEKIEKEEEENEE